MSGIHLVGGLANMRISRQMTCLDNGSFWIRSGFLSRFEVYLGVGCFSFLWKGFAEGLLTLSLNLAAQAVVL